MNDWIPIKTRQATEEDIKYYKEHFEDAEDLEYVFDCPLPEDGQEVLITTWAGDVAISTFCEDCWGSYFEDYEDDDDVKAWMSLPKPYEGE